MPADDHLYDHLPVSLDDSSVGFLNQLELSGVDYDTVDQMAHYRAEQDISIVIPEVGDDISIIYPETGQFSTVDQATQGMIDAVDTVPARRSPPTTSTPNRRPGQPAGTPNTVYSPRGVGRARVDPATSMRQANIMDIFPVEVHGCTSVSR